MMMKKINIFLMLLPMIILIGCKSDEDSKSLVTPQVQNPEGTLFLTTETSTTLLDLATGEQIASLVEPFYKPIAYQNSIFYFTNSELVRTSSIGGEEVWRKGFDELLGNRNEFNRSKPEIIGNRVYVAYRNLNLTTFESIYYLEIIDLSDGRGLLTLIRQPENIFNLITFDDALITVEVTTEVLIRKRDKETGAILAEISAPDGIAEFFVSGNSLMVLSRKNTIISLDANLNINWTYNTSSFNNGYFTFLDSGNFIFYSFDNKITALDIATGNSVWQKEIPLKRPMGLYKYQGDYIAFNVEGMEMELLKIDPDNGTILEETIFPLEPNNQFDDFGMTFFEGNILFAQGFNGPRDPILTMAQISGDVVWTRDYSTSFSNLWLLKTQTGTYTNDQVF